MNLKKFFRSFFVPFQSNRRSSVLKKEAFLSWLGENVECRASAWIGFLGSIYLLSSCVVVWFSFLESFFFDRFLVLALEITWWEEEPEFVGVSLILSLIDGGRFCKGHCVSLVAGDILGALGVLAWEMRRRSAMMKVIGFWESMIILLSSYISSAQQSSLV